MNGLEPQQSFHSTSAAGAMLWQVSEPVLVGRMLAGLGTSTPYAAPPDAVLRYQSPAEQTTAGAVVAVPQTAGGAIGELRRISGLTWEQLARLFNVSRRSLHFWASGKPMAATNEEHLQRVLAVVRKIDRGSASANRAALLGVREDASLPFDLLATGHYDHVVSLVGSGAGRGAALPKLSDTVRAARAPRPPEALVGALQDRIHPTSGRLRGAKAIATPRVK